MSFWLRQKDDGGAKGAHGPTTVGYVVVNTQPLNLTQELAGRTSAYLVSEVRPQVGGIIKARLFTEGGQVTAGQSLYQIDAATYQAAYDSALAQQAQAQANYDSAKQRPIATPSLSASRPLASRITTTPRRR